MDMVKESIMNWLSLDEAAQYLKCEQDYLGGLVRQKKVPHTVLPDSDTVLFSTDRLDQWLLGQEKGSAPVGLQGGTVPSLIDSILQRFGYAAKAKSRYTNLYKGTKVFAQIHPNPDGVDVAIKEAEGNTDMPKCDVLQPVSIDSLHGYWRANKDWLVGNGQRYTNQRAVAFHVPSELGNDSQHPGWSELERLLKYAFAKA
jgi:hypothetical protein